MTGKAYPSDGTDMEVASVDQDQTDDAPRMTPKKPRPSWLWSSYQKQRKDLYSCRNTGWWSAILPWLYASAAFTF